MTSATAPVAQFSLALWCVLAAALLPMVCAWIAKSGRMRARPDAGGFDNHDPRAWLAQQTHWRARANAAQANSFEALPFFIAAVVIALLLGAGQPLLDLLAGVYLLLRIGYVALYIADRPTARSMTWAAAFLVNVAILFIGYR